MSKKFLITVSTGWCGMDNTFSAIAENESDLEKIADELSYENFQQYDCTQYIAEEHFEDTENMTDEDWNYISVIESEYYHFSISEYDPENDSEWEDYECVYNCEEELE